MPTHDTSPERMPERPSAKTLSLELTRTLLEGGDLTPDERDAAMRLYASLGYVLGHQGAEVAVPESEGALGVGADVRSFASGVLDILAADNRDLSWMPGGFPEAVDKLDRVVLNHPALREIVDKFKEYSFGKSCELATEDLSSPAAFAGRVHAVVDSLSRPSLSGATTACSTIVFQAYELGILGGEVNDVLSEILDLFGLEIYIPEEGDNFLAAKMRVYSQSTSSPGVPRNRVHRVVRPGIVHKKSDGGVQPEKAQVVLT